MSIKNLFRKTSMDKVKMQCRFIIWMFIAYSFIAVFTVVSFGFVFFTILPAVNSIGLTAFGQNEFVLLSYGILPFICIDMCIVRGYFFVLKIIVKRIIRFYKTERINSHG